MIYWKSANDTITPLFEEAAAIYICLSFPYRGHLYLQAPLTPVRPEYVQVNPDNIQF